MHHTTDAVKVQEFQAKEKKSTLLLLRTFLDALTRTVEPVRRRLLTPRDRMRLLDKVTSQILEQSGGQLYLVSPIYRGRYRRMWLHHITCGGWFQLSLAEFNAAGGKDICPYCHPCTDLTKFGETQNLAHHVYNLSLGNVTLLSPRIRGYRSMYQFKCGRHNLLYTARYSDFATSSNTSNGCPACAKELRDHRQQSY